MLAIAPAGAAVIHVDVDIGASGDGTSWDQAKQTINEGVLLLTDGDSIWVAEGTYSETTTSTLSVSNTALYGGFSGIESALNERDLTNNVVTIYKRSLTFDITGDNVTLDGFTLTGAPDSSGNRSGHGYAQRPW